MAAVEDNSDLFKKVDSLKEQFPEVFYSKNGVFDKQTQVELQIKLLQVTNDQMKLQLEKEKMFWEKIGAYAKYGFLLLLAIVFIYLVIQIARLDAADVFVNFLKNRGV